MSEKFEMDLSDSVSLQEILDLRLGTKMAISFDDPITHEPLTCYGVWIQIDKHQFDELEGMEGSGAFQAFETSEESEPE